jgi:predicted amidohydrolase YtcJ
MKFLMAGVLAMAVLAGACSKRSETAQEREVRAAIQEHLQKKGTLAMNNMTMDVQSVKVNGDTADAEVRFQSKEKPELAVGMHYVLHRTNGKWEVQSGNPTEGMGGDSHQSMEKPQSAAPGAQPSTPQPEASH